MFTENEFFMLFCVLLDLSGQTHNAFMISSLMSPNDGLAVSQRIGHEAECIRHTCSLRFAADDYRLQVNISARPWKYSANHKNGGNNIT